MLTHARYQHACPSLQSEFALCFHGRLRDELIGAGAPVRDLGAVRLRDPLSVRRARRNLEELVRREKFDAIVTHSSWTQTVFGRSLRAADAPLVFYLHAPANGQHLLERLGKRTRPDLIICNSEFTAGSVTGVYSGIETQVFYYPVAAPANRRSNGTRKSLRAALHTPEDATVIIQVGRMERWKGHALHLQALSKLKDTRAWVCWIVGGAQRPSESSYLDDLKTLADQLGIANRIRFVGQRDDVDQLLAAADIFCQPNAEGEPFGIVFIEALHAGLPVITCDFGAAREIVDDSCGARVPPGNAEVLAQALGRLIQNPDLRARLGRDGNLRANTLCNPANQLQKFQSAIDSLIQRQQVTA